MNQFKDKIDDYLSGKLPSSEVAAMEKAMEEDPELKKALIRQKVFNEAINLLVEEDLKEKLNPKKQARVRRLWRPMSMAASFLILIVAAPYWWASNQFSDQKILEVSYLDAADGSSRVVIDSLPLPASQTFQQAYSAFARNEDEKAIQLFQSIVNDEEYAVDADYYLGHLHFRKEDFNPAAKRFKAVTDRPNLPVYIPRQEVEANYLLARFGEGDLTPDSLKLLSELLEKQNPKKASRLRRRLNNPIARLIY